MLRPVKAKPAPKTRPALTGPARGRLRDLAIEYGRMLAARVKLKN